jgi:hypothetical protein
MSRRTCAVICKPRLGSHDGWSPSPEQIELVIDCVTARLAAAREGRRTPWRWAAHGLDLRQAHWDAISRAGGAVQGAQNAVREHLGERYLKEEARP